MSEKLLQEQDLEQEVGLGYSYDNPDKRDFTFDDFEEFASGETETKKRPKDKIKIRNQGNTPACTMYASTIIVNANNLIEDEKLGVNREQVDPAEYWNMFCNERGFDNMGSDIQTLAKRHKKKGNIEGYITIRNTEKRLEQMKKALDMGYFLSTGSAYGDWGTIRRTGVYSERADKKFVGHAFSIVDYDDNEQMFLAVNSWGETRGVLNGYFKIPYDMVNRIYSCLIYIDKDDSNYFKRFAEIQKVKQAIELLREVYRTTTLDGVKNYLEKVQFGKNLSDIYGVVI